MYSDVIGHADETLTANRLVRANSADLRAHTNALMLTYRAHRFPQVCGASDASITPRTTDVDRAAMMRSKIRSGALPRPAETPEKCWVGKGTKRLCDGCGAALAPDDLEYELDISSGGILLFDANCLAAWSGLRAERMAGSDAID